MTETLAITLLGEPVAWARTRGRFRFMPAHQRNVTAALRLKAEEVMDGRTMLEGPLRVDFVAEFGVPASWSKKKRAAAPGQPVTKRPDADNLAKLAADALNGVVYKDDAQIAEARICKVYSTQPKITVTISVLTAPPSESSELFAIRILQQVRRE